MILYTHSKVPQTFVDHAEAGSEGLLVDASILVEGTTIVAVETGGTLPDAAAGAEVRDLGGRIVLPGFVDSHVHVDKAFSWYRAPNPRGEFWDAIQALSDDKVNWTAEDLYKRGSFALRCAYAHGTVAMRSHVDTGLDFGETSHAVMHQLREEWKDRIALQTVSLTGVELYRTPGGRKIAEKTVAYPDALIGGMPQMNLELDADLDYLFDLAAELGVGVDLHVDENGDAGAECFRRVAEAVLRKEFPHPVTCGHVCSLAVQDPVRAQSTITLAKEAGLNVISLPLCNLYLQGRDSQPEGAGTPRRRGITLLHEFYRAGVTAACASDNVRDAFYAWGDFDCFEVMTAGVRIAHLDTILGEAAKMVTANPAKILGLEKLGRIAPGADARMIAFEARTFNELLSRPSQRRELLNFPSVEAVPPYAELGF